MTDHIMTDHIRITRQDRITTLVIDREDKKNAITQDMYAAMADALNDFAGDDTARVFVITGVADVFTAGNDLKDFAMGPRDHDTPPVLRFLAAIRDCPKPVVASVNGLAIGIGLTMLLHCDLVYAAERATFSAPFVRLGLVPEAASSMLLPATVGMAIANDILLTGRTLDAAEALDFGLIARVFPDADLDAGVAAIAAGVAAMAPTALRESKALIRSRKDQITQQMAAESQVFAAQLKSADFAESVAAMMQKRPPVYK